MILNTRFIYSDFDPVLLLGYQDYGVLIHLYASPK